MQFGYAVLLKKTPLCLTAISMPALLLARSLDSGANIYNTRQFTTIHANLIKTI
jgi:hypothetical protein